MLADERKKAIGRWTAWWLGLMLMAPLMVQAERLPIKTYTTADGLAHDRVKRIVRDSRGFLWFCTAAGLSRFDGYRFITYREEHGLSHSSTNDIVETGKGLYWVATNGGGVCRFNPDLIENQKAKSKRQKGKIRNLPSAIRHLFTVYPVGDEPATNRVNVLYEDRRGRLWAGTDGGLFRLDETNRQAAFRRLELGLPSHPDRLVQVWALVEDREGSLWIGTSWGLVRRWPDGRMVHYTVQPVEGADHVAALLVDRQGRLWVGHRAGLIRLQPSRLPNAEFRLGNEDFAIRNSQFAIHRAGDVRWYTIADGLADNWVLALHQSSDGRIWIGTYGGGLSEFDGQRFRSYTTAQGLSDNRIGALDEDPDGNLWVGTLISGTMKIARNGFTSYTEADGLGNTIIDSIFEDQAGEVCVISRQHFINRFDRRRFTASRPNLPPHIANCSEVRHALSLQDHTGEWWVATSEGLYRFPKVSRVEQLARARPKAVYTVKDGLASNDVERLFEDSRGDIWIGIRSRARDMLIRWERASSTFHCYSQADGLPPFNRPITFCEDAAGNLWIGFWEGGLARYRKGRFTLLGESEGVPAGQILGLYCDRAGRLWIASSKGGLGRLDDPEANLSAELAQAGRLRVVTYTTAEGLASNIVHCIAEDGWGRMYIGTARGVVRLDPATGRIKRYTTADGLSNSEVQVAFRDRQGRLWFGTPNGLSRLIPEQDRPKSPPPIWIGGLHLAGISYPLSELGETQLAGIELGPDQNQVQIDFCGLGFAVGEALRYQYKLEGTDQDWSALTDQRSINYANLLPGAYRFLVRAVSVDGLTSPTPASVAFTILPPIWQRWWFLALAAMFTGLMVYAIHRYRLARLLELERVRTRIATDLHDDIGASLSRMAILSEVVKREIDFRHQPSIQRLTEIADTARELVDTMSDIVWSIDPRRDDLKNVIARIRQFASDVLEARGIDWEFQTPPEPEKVKLSPEHRRHIFLIFKEAINNMVRHADCDSVWLSLGIGNGRLVAEIRDNGRGFSQAQPSEGEWGHGLKNMQARAAELGGRVRIESTPGQGTHLTLIVPLK